MKQKKELLLCGLLFSYCFAMQPFKYDFSVEISDVVAMQSQFEQRKQLPKVRLVQRAVTFDGRILGTIEWRLCGFEFGMRGNLISEYALKFFPVKGKPFFINPAFPFEPLPKGLYFFWSDCCGYFCDAKILLCVMNKNILVRDVCGRAYYSNDGQNYVRYKGRIEKRVFAVD